MNWYVNILQFKVEGSKTGEAYLTVEGSGILNGPFKENYNFRGYYVSFALDDLRHVNEGINLAWIYIYHML